MDQGLELIAKLDCQFNIGAGRPWQVKAGQKFWVTSATYKNIEGCMVDRKGKGTINSGVYLTKGQIAQVFDV